MREKIAVGSENSSSRFPVKAVETLAGNRTLTKAEIDAYQFMAFDPGGAGRNLVLPAEAESQGALLFVANKADGAEILTIQNDAPATVCTPTQGECAVLWCDGANWYGLVGAFS